MSIPFNVPYLAGNELKFIQDSVISKKISGNGKYSKLCSEYFESKFKFKKVLLTTSCTDALEMAAILCNIKPGDEILMPSYTFVSTANAFVLRGAKIIFVDSQKDNPNMDADALEELINEKTKVIVPVHYAGISCDMHKIMKIAKKHNILVIEDAAQAIDSYYEKKPLGSIGHLSTFSFHETKNIVSGEGGMLVINEDKFIKRAEIIWEKGTNRAAFWRGEVDKYKWVDIGSSYLPSEIISAYLYAQLEELERIQEIRKRIWQSYYDQLIYLEEYGVRLPYIPEFATNNAHLFYLICNSHEERTLLMEFLNQSNINAVSHYICLHDSPYYIEKHDGRKLSNSKHYENCLIRLPLHCYLSSENQQLIINSINKFYENR